MMHRGRHCIRSLSRARQCCKNSQKFSSVFSSAASSKNSDSQLDDGVQLHCRSSSPEQSISSIISRSPVTISQAQPDRSSLSKNSDPNIVEELISNSKKRCMPVNNSALREIYQHTNAQLVGLQREIRQLQTRQNQLAKFGRDGIIDEERRAEGGRIKAEIANLTVECRRLTEEVDRQLLELPNRTHPLSPIGAYSSAKVTKSIIPPNVLSRDDHVAPPPAEELEPEIQYNPHRDHLNIMNALGWVNQHAGAKITGSSWTVLQSTGALLEFALTQYAMSKAIAAGFIPILTPDVVKAELVSRCGFNPRDDEAHQTYFISNGNETNTTSSTTTSNSAATNEQLYESSPQQLALCATAEIPLAGYFHSSTLPASALPIKFVSLGRAFRAEAGSRGRESRGLYRLHQFSKVELFSVCEEEKSDAMLQELVDVQMSILSDLGLSLRLLEMPSEELGASAYRKFDIEAWMPGRGSWGELASASNCTDYQSRRLSIRYRRPDNQINRGDKSKPQVKSPYAHTLNATAAAMPRLIVALIEQGVRFEESSSSTTRKISHIELPSTLRPFFISPNSKSDDIIRWV